MPCRGPAFCVFQDHGHRSQEQQRELPLRGGQKGSGEHDVPQEPAFLLYRLPQSLARLKLHRFAGGDLNGGAGLGGSGFVTKLIHLLPGQPSSRDV